MNNIASIYNKSRHTPKYIPTYKNAKLIDLYKCFKECFYFVICKILMSLNHGIYHI